MSKRSPVVANVPVKIDYDSDELVHQKPAVYAEPMAGSRRANKVTIQAARGGNIIVDKRDAGGIRHPIRRADSEYDREGDMIMQNNDLTNRSYTRGSDGSKTMKVENGITFVQLPNGNWTSQRALAAARPPTAQAEDNIGQMFGGSEIATDPLEGRSQWIAERLSDGTAKWVLADSVVPTAGFKVPKNFPTDEVMKKYRDADESFLANYQGCIMAKRPLGGITLRWNGANLYTTSGKLYRFEKESDNKVIEDFTVNWPSNVAFDGILYVPYEDDAELQANDFPYANGKKTRDTREVADRKLELRVRGRTEKLEEPNGTDFIGNWSTAAKFMIVDMWSVTDSCPLHKRLSKMKERIGTPPPSLKLHYMKTAPASSVDQLVKARDSCTFHEVLVLMDRLGTRTDVSLEPMVQPKSLQYGKLTAGSYGNMSGPVISFKMDHRTNMLEAFKVQSEREGEILVHVADKLPSSRNSLGSLEARMEYKVKKDDPTAEPAALDDAIIGENVKKLSAPQRYFPIFPDGTTLLYYKKASKLETPVGSAQDFAEELKEYNAKYEGKYVMEYYEIN